MEQAVEKHPLPESRYDLNTYWGRVLHCARMSSPLNLLHSKEGIRDAQHLLDDYEQRHVPLSERVWMANQIVRSSVHPDTGDIVPLPFRMSASVLSNLVVTVGMLTPNLTPTGTVFWQWMNQSLNVAINSANANKSHPLSTRQMVTSYFLAVGGSCGVAVGLGALVPRLRSLKPTTRTVLSRLVPFAAVVSAGLLNIGLMRSQEIVRGIDVYDCDSGEKVGTSRWAAFRAVAETGASRVINATPIMVLPPLILYKLERTVLKNRGMRALTMANLGLIAATSFAVLPLALAIFPQRREIAGTKLEPEFAKYPHMCFNRGI